MTFLLLREYRELGLLSSRRKGYLEYSPLPSTVVVVSAIEHTRFSESILRRIRAPSPRDKGSLSFRILK